jgi:CubicO group peptidase (beta-lactamase class C family)
MPAVQQIDEALQHAVETKDVPGVVAMATHDQDILYQGAFGKRGLPDGADMTLDSVFWIASMTKALTATAAMQLVEQGKLELEQTLGHLVPELASPQVLEGFDSAGAPRLRPAKRPITLRHLLTHTAGFSYEMWNADIGKYMQHAGIPGVITCQNAALRTPLVFDPGERWEYGINIDWAGKVVEVVSGKTLDAYLRDHLFTPLGMQDTGFKLRPDQQARLVGMHARTPEGLQPIPFEIPQEPEFHMGGGGLYSTAADYLKFIQMILRGGRSNGAQVLKPETVALMSRNHIGEICVSTLKTVQPEVSHDANLFPDMEQKWGLSFAINTEATSHGRSAGSLAWAGLGNTYFWIDPGQHVGGVILTQILPFADPKVLDLFAQLERGVYTALTAA